MNNKIDTIIQEEIMQQYMREKIPTHIRRAYPIDDKLDDFIIQISALHLEQTITLLFYVKHRRDA